MLSRQSTIATLLILVAFSTVHAQRGGMNIYDHLLIRASDRYYFQDPEFTYEGSPYLNDEFVPGYVDAGNEKFHPVPMRLNIYADVMEFQEGGQLYLLEPDPRIKKIEMGGRTFVVETEKKMAKTETGFRELLESGPLTLLAKKGVNYRKAMPLQGVPAKFARMADTHYVKVEGRPESIKVGSIKNLIKDLPDHQEAVKKFAKDQGISSNDEEDLLKLVRFYNSLALAD